MDVSSVLLYLGTMLVVEPLYLLGIHLSNLVISLYEIVGKPPILVPPETLF